MASIVCIKTKVGLHPADDLAADALAKLSNGQDVLIEVKAKRNIRRHRLAWKLASILFENTEIWPSVECVMDSIKIGTGHCDTWFDPVDGTVQQRAKSIAFHNMEEVDFAQFLSRAVTLISSRWLAGIEEAELLAKVNAVLDGPLPERRVA